MSANVPPSFFARHRRFPHPIGIMKSRILIVDDDRESARGLRSILLRSIDCDVVLAFDGGEAIGKAFQEKPDLILLDIQLPVLDGFQVLAKIKARGISTRVIMFSAYRVDIATAVQAIKEGACDYLTKPIDASDIVEHIKRALLTESTINLNLANEATPLLRRLLESLENSSKNRGRASHERIDDHYVPATSLKDRFAKHWLIAIVSVCAVVATVTWQIVMNLYVYPRDFELNRVRKTVQLEQTPAPSATSTPR